MGLFAFRRLRELEAASNEAASFPIAEPAPKLEIPEPAPAVTEDGNFNRRNSGRRKRQQLSDAE